MESNDSPESTADTDTGIAGKLTERQKHILIGSGVVFFISLGVLIPALGIFIGWIFTLGGGFAGGATVGYLRSNGGRDGAKYGLIVALVGGIPSSIVGVVFGTIINTAVLSSQPGSESQAGGMLIIAAIGLVSGIFFKIFGGVVGGGLVGWFFDEEAH